MFPCARTCSRACLSRSNEVLSHHEHPIPLLFLYPSWFRRGWHRLQHSGLVSATESRTLANKSNDQGESSPSLPISRYSPQKSPQFTAKTQTATQKRDLEGLSIWRNSVVTGSSDLREESIPNASDSAATSSSDETQQAAVSTNQQTRASSRAKRRFRTVISKRKDLDYAPRNLRFDVLADALLAYSIPAHETFNDTDTVHINKETLFRLTGSTDENTWLHHDGSGCTIHALPAHPQTIDRRTLNLKGSARAREIAKAYLETFESDSNTTTVKGYLGEQSINRFAHISKVPRPAEWNLRTVYEYIKVITSFRPRQGVTRHMYAIKTYHQVVGRIFESLFKNPEFIAFLSTKALRKALKFCREHTELGGVAVQIWEVAIAHGLRPSLAMYNEEIGRALGNGNEKQCLQVMREMSDSGLPPNAQTWSVLMGYIDDTSTRTKIVNRLKAEGYFQDSCSKVVVANAFIKKDFAFLVAKTGGIEHFIREMDILFGNDWLGSQGVTNMLRLCCFGRYPHFQANRILTIAKQAKKNGVELTTSSVVQLLQISRKMGNMKDSVELLRTAPLRNNRSNDQILISIIFGLAWNRQWYNMSRVLWHYAATAGIITHEMKQVVKHGLTTNITNVTNNSFLRTWNLVAGKFIVGTNLDTKDFEKLFSFLSKQDIKHTPVEWLLQWTPNDGTRNDQMMLAHLIMERDLNAWRFFKRIQWDRFLDLVQQALKKDLEWKQGQIPKNQSDTWLIDHAIQVPLSPRQKPLSFQTRNIQDSDVRQWFIINNHKLDMTTLQLAERPRNRRKDARKGSNLNAINIEDEHLERKVRVPETMDSLKLQELNQIAPHVSGFHQPRTWSKEINEPFSQGSLASHL